MKIAYCLGTPKKVLVASYQTVFVGFIAVLIDGLFVKCSAISKATVCTKVQNTAFSTNRVSDVLKHEY
jgi:hypothetical protein